LMYGALGLSARQVRLVAADSYKRSVMSREQ
jgi:hypothetical protein